MRYVAISLCVVAAACGGPTPTTPTSSLSLIGGTSATPDARVGTAVRQAEGGSHVTCAVNIGSIVQSLPLIQLIQTWLNISINSAASSLNCGQVESLNAKLSVVAEKVVQHVPAAACGASTALVNELHALVEGGRLATPTLTPPPGGPTNVLMAAEGLKAHWCATAH